MGRTAVLLGGIFVVPFAVGLWRERRRPELRPFLAYFALMFVAMGAVFTFHAPKGAFYHSSLAWLPFAAPLAVASIAPTATAAGRAWPFLRRAGHASLPGRGRAGRRGRAVAGRVGGAAGAMVATRTPRLQLAGGFLVDQRRPVRPW